MSAPTRRYTQITKAVYERPWALQPAMLAVIEEIVRLRAAGAPFTDEEIEARVAAADNGPRRGGLRAQGVAVIPIYGVITQRLNLMTAMSGGTSVEGITRDFREAMADPDVGAIVFDIDSPGGSVDGITELATEIRSARGVKPMAAVANPTMASAAYWIGSQADEVIGSPSAIVGSVGIIGMHHDVSKADEMEGVKVTLITAGAGKADGNEHLPLSDEGRAELQGIADDYYALFVGDVAAGRGVKATQVISGWKADVFTAKKAKTAGLVDRVETLDATVHQMILKANGANPSFLAAAGLLPVPEAISALMATLPIHEQAALWDSERDRMIAHYRERERLRAKEGRPLSAQAREQLAALTPLDVSDPVATDLDTDEPEEADASPPHPMRLAAARASAALATSHVRREVSGHV